MSCNRIRLESFFIRTDARPMNQPSLDADTLALAASGDEAAWRVIVGVYGPRVFGLLQAQCRDAELAEEVTQSVFCTLATKIRQRNEGGVGGERDGMDGVYREQGRFEPWLFRIAINRLRDEMRGRSRRARNVESLDERAGTEQGGSLARAGAATGAGPELREELQQMHAAIGQLPEADRLVIQLRHLADLSFKQIAELLEEPLGTVLARQHRALKKLKDMMTAPTPGTVVRGGRSERDE